MTLSRTVLPISPLLVLLAASAPPVDFTFVTKAGPFNVTTSGFNVVFNDAANTTEPVPAPPMGEIYTSFELTCTWTAGGGGPWSSEAEITLTYGSSTVEVDPPTSGSADNGATTTLTFSGSILGYDPSVDATIEVFMDQSFSGSDADWSDLSLKLSTGLAPTPPATLATLVPCATITNTLTSGGVHWYKVDHSGGDLTVDTEGSTVSDTEIAVFNGLGSLLGQDDDGGTSLLSSLTLTDLPAGCYYVATGAFNMTFGGGFMVTSTGTSTDDVTVNATATPVCKFGSGCGASTTPEIGWMGDATTGTMLTITLAGAPTMEMCTLTIGASNTMWGVTPLPYDLGNLGFTSCDLLVSIQAQMPFMTTDMSGASSFTLTIPASAAGTTWYWQWLIIDGGSDVAVSDALETSIP